MLQFFIIVYSLVVLLMIKVNKKNGILINDLFWLIMSWMLVIGLHFTSGIIYRYKASTNTIVYISFIFIIFVSFRYLGKRTKIKDKLYKNPQNNNQEKYIDTRRYFYIASIGYIIYFIDVFRLNTLNFGVKSDIRISIMGTVSFLVVPLLLIIWLYEVSYSIKNNIKIKFHAKVSALMYCMISILYSGRQTLLIFILISFIVITYSNSLSKNLKKKSIISKNKAMKSIKIICLVFIPLVLIYTMFLSGNRYGNSMIAMFEFVSGGHISSQTVNFANLFGNLSSVIINFLFYFSQQLSKLEIILNDYHGPYMLGMFQLNYVSRRLPAFLELDYNLVFNEVTNIMWNRGIPAFDSAFETMIGSAIFDFGRIGAIIYFAILGYLVGSSRNIFNRNKSSLNIILQGMICVGMFVSVQSSPFFDSTWAYALFWLLIIMMIEKKIIIKK